MALAPRHTGSPPRAWGLLEQRLLAAVGCRLTPTCVGTAGSRCTRSAPTPAHPHVRGDCATASFEMFYNDGSPPRAWGLRLRARSSASPSRLTPTCVGTASGGTPSRAGRCGSPPRAWGLPSRSGLHSSSRSAHPHVRGDCATAGTDTAGNNGSPPRAWGLLARARRDAPLHRLTPTCVGTAVAHRCSRSAKAAHPHVRGDCASMSRTERARLGSPPRAWGLRHLVPLVNRGFRLTPTCVGTARWPDRRRAGAPAHPHVRGDCDRVHRVAAGEHGSPPRAWGLRQRAPAPAVRFRLTPTCVGTARCRASAAPRCPAHPHVRGDCPSSRGMSSPRFGSPPRAWGLRSGCGARSSRCRLTPTCVGTATSDRILRPSIHGSPPRAWGLLDRSPLSVKAPRLTPTCVGTAPRSTRQ